MMLAGNQIANPEKLKLSDYFTPLGIEIIEKVVADEGQTFLGWRDVPVDSSCLGESVKPTEPHHCQIFIGKSAAITDARHTAVRLSRMQ